MFVKVLLPLYQESLVYSVPPDCGTPEIGMRVSVPLGKRKLYSGIVVEILDSFTNGDFTVKAIVDIIDDSPIVGAQQLRFWQWIAQYYMCTLGEVMKAALPACFKLESERTFGLNADVSDGLIYSLGAVDRMIVNALAGGKLSIEELSKKINRKNILPNIGNLLRLGIVDDAENMDSSFRHKYIDLVRLHPDFDDEKKLADALASMRKGSKQELLMMKYLEFAEPLDFASPLEIAKTELLARSGISTEIYRAVEKKGLFVTLKKQVNRIDTVFKKEKSLPDLSLAQMEAYMALKESARTALLFGITSSGKTEIYIRLIADALQNNQQVLYLLPEIALTTQIVARLGAVFGDRTAVYHSRFSDAERAETYNMVLNLRNSDNQACLVVGVRSSLFLPFSNLGLIIVDEEHENTYKQFEPAPRYHARDAAVMAGTIYGAKTVLGSATPSLESFTNALAGKYALVRLSARYGNVHLPEIKTIDMKRAFWRKKIVANFSEGLLNEIRNTLNRGEQVILFQNRRGYSPYIQCNDCNAVIRCRQCDVSLTYHKYDGRLNCHYCGYSIPLPPACPACKSADLKTKGFGTEKVEDELQILIPEAKTERLDLDSAKSKHAFDKILSDFASGSTNVLVGTQMIAKGLDFPNIGLVGILDADSLLNFPDFRAYERSFQLMAQVAGRSGRKNGRGMVVIQTTTPANHLIRQVINHDYEGFFREQVRERREFNYPPFSHLLIISLKHTDKPLLYEAGNSLKAALTGIFGQSLSGPEAPPVARVRNRYILNLRIKLSKNNRPEYYKKLLADVLSEFKKDRRYASVLTVVDVDAY